MTTAPRHFDLTLPHGITLACRGAGAGRARVLLLHGFPEAAFVWDEVMQRLAPQAACVAPNLRGYPGSSAPADVEAYRSRHLVADIGAVIEALGAPVDLLVAQHCKSEQKVERDYLKKIGFPEADVATTKFMRGTGCEECRQLGYQGRLAIYELLVLTEQLRPHVLGRAASSTIAQRAIEQGMRTLRDDGWNKVRNGVTTIEEILRVTQIEEHLDSLGNNEKAGVWMKSQKA